MIFFLARNALTKVYKTSNEKIQQDNSIKKELNLALIRQKDPATIEDRPKSRFSHLFPSHVTKRGDLDVEQKL